MSNAERILSIVARVADTDEVLRDPELRLYDRQVLDSLGTVELIVAFGRELGVEISPAELDREEWATPRHIVEWVAARMRKSG